MSQVFIGVDLGGTNARSAVVTAEGKLISRDSRETNAPGGPEAVMAAMEASIDSALSQAGMTRADVCAGAIGAPGPMNWQTGVVYTPPNLPGWHHVPLAELMTHRMGFPVFVENDANVACYGEFWSGAARGAETVCMLTLGTGVGGGLIVFGKLMRGIDGTAAETGHLCIVRDGRLCGCGARGCLEAYGSVTGMVRTAVEGIEAGRATTLTTACAGDTSKLTGKMISEAATQGDEFAKWVLAETGRYLGCGIASLINLLNPEKIVLYGGMTAAGALLLEPLRETVARQCFEVPAKRAQIVLAELGGDAGVIGAAGCARTRWQG